MYYQSQKERSYRIRSVSLPARSHPLFLQFDHQVNHVKTWVVTSTTLTTSDLCSGLGELVKLHSCFRSLLGMAETKKVVSGCRKEAWVGEELDGVVRLLDFCKSTRDGLCEMRKQAQELESCLRTRRRGDPVFETKVRACGWCRKKVVKDVGKCLKSLKKRRKYCQGGGGICFVEKAMKEVREVTISVFQVVFWFLSIKTSLGGDVGCGVVGKVLRLRPRGSCSSIFELCEKVERKEVEMVDLVQMVKELERGFGEVEEGLECLFQSLIQNRVMLLNIVNM